MGARFDYVGVYVGTVVGMIWSHVIYVDRTKCVRVCPECFEAVGPSLLKIFHSPRYRVKISKPIEFKTTRFKATTERESDYAQHF